MLGDRHGRHPNRAGPALDEDLATFDVSSHVNSSMSRRELEELERSLTPTLAQFAADRRHMDLVRESCRRTVAEFVDSQFTGAGAEEGEDNRPLSGDSIIRTMRVIDVDYPVSI